MWIRNRPITYTEIGITCTETDFKQTLVLFMWKNLFIKRSGRRWTLFGHLLKSYKIKNKKNAHRGRTFQEGIRYIFENFWKWSQFWLRSWWYINPDRNGIYTVRLTCIASPVNKWSLNTKYWRMQKMHLSLFNAIYSNKMNSFFTTLLVSKLKYFKKLFLNSVNCLYM